MPFIPAAQTIQAEMRYLYSTQKCENVLYFQASAGVSVSLMQTLGNNLIGWWNTNFKPLVSTILQLNEVYLTDLTTQTGPTVSVVTGLPSAGTDASEVMPFNVSLCISFRTAGRGRSARGRNYLLGMTEADVNGNGVLSTFFSPILAAYTTLIGAGTFTPGLQWVVVSRQFNGVDRSNALVQPITSCLFVDSIVDSQRRRLPGRGR
jgi:hypothetical protein